MSRRSPSRSNSTPLISFGVAAVFIFELKRLAIKQGVFEVVLLEKHCGKTNRS